MKNLEIKSENAIKTIALSKLVAHPDNPNSMSDSAFGKLVRNIERTGLYEPIVVRPHPDTEGSCATADKFQIINGHHRVKALEQLGREEADCVVWDVDDEQTAILLTTLNRLAGTDIPAKKMELLRKLTQRMEARQLAKLLPQTSKQIERLAVLKDSVESATVSVQCGQFAIPLIFFVTRQQQEIIEKAIETAFNGLRIADRTQMTKAQQRAAAITEIARGFMEGKKCQAE